MYSTNYSSNAISFITEKNITSYVYDIVTAQIGIMNCQIECHCDNEGNKVTPPSLRSRTHEVQGNWKEKAACWDFTHPDNYAVCVLNNCLSKQKPA